MEVHPPSKPVECSDCGGEIEWGPIVWDFAEEMSEVTKERRAFGGFCSDCGLIEEIGVGEIEPPEIDFSPRDVDTGPNRGIEFHSSALGETVRASVDLTVGRVDDGVFQGEIKRVEGDYLEDLSGEAVWMDFVSGEVLIDDQSEVIGVELSLFEEEE